MVSVQNLAEFCFCTPGESVNWGLNVFHNVGATVLLLVKSIKGVSVFRYI